MIFNGVTLPDELRIALEEGKLVIFAGAGVSCPPPSSLPTFEGLVRYLAADKDYDKTASSEQILGGFLRDGIKVHQATADRLLSNTKPTDLHRELIRVFGAAEKVRLVTTNFDNHFTDAAKEVFPKKSITEYHGPALPLGDDFEGIVYLHGAARIAPLRQVLTDVDFGMAYLTRGWARDFLIKLFSKYTVAFVGYRHGDIIVSYLARGMSPAEIKPRWAFIASDASISDSKRWKHLDIKTVTYPKDLGNHDNDHQPLTEFFRGWAQHQQSTLLDHSAKVIVAASGLPPEGNTEGEFILYCLQQSQLAQDFLNAIKHPAWIGWMEQKKLFEPFFSATGTYRRGDILNHQQVLGAWLCNYVRQTHPDLLFDLIRRNNGIMSGAFANMLGHALFNQPKTSPDPNYGTWLSLLVAQGSSTMDGRFWGYLLLKCEIPQHTAIALRLFEELTTANLCIDRYWSIPLSEEETDADGKAEHVPNSPRVDFQVQWSREADNTLHEGWETVLKPQMIPLSEPLCAIATKHLIAAHQLLRSVGKANVGFDRLNWSISSIAPHPQNRDSLHRILSLLVTVLRELLDQWLKVNRPRALGQMEAWWAAEAPLLRRLVIYGIANDTGRSSDEKLTWLLEHELVFAIGMKKEVFDVLREAYASASEPMRQRVVVTIETGPTGVNAEHLSEVTKAYESYNALQWLASAMPNCRFAEEAIAKIKKVHPSFGVREHPDFDHWHSGASFSDPKDEFDFAQILSEPAEKYLAELLNSKDTALGKDRWAYLSNLKFLFEKNRVWGQAFMDAAVRVECFREDVWHNVFSAWRELLKTKSDLEWILNQVEALPSDVAISSGTAHLFCGRLWSDKLVTTIEMANRGVALVLKAWEVCRAQPYPADSTSKDWLTAAINRAGGWIGECLVEHCNFLRGVPGEKYEIPTAIRQAIVAAVRGTDAVSVDARIAMTPFIAYFFVWDRMLVSENFLPLFDWKRDPIVAQQTWSVVLNFERGRNLELDKALIPYYRQCAAEMTAKFREATERKEQFDSHALQSLGWHLFSLVISAFPNPLESEFFIEVLPVVAPITRMAIADAMGEWFRGLAESDQRAKWNHWMRTYWERRVLGIPITIDAEEAHKFVEMAVGAKDQFPELVNLAEQMTLKDIWPHPILEAITAAALDEKFPEATTRLLIKVLNSDQYGFLDDGLKGVHARLAVRIPQSELLKELENLMYLRGWKK